MYYKGLFAYILLVSALVTPIFTQTTNFMQEETNETVPQYHYTEKELEKVSAYIDQQYGASDLVAHEVFSPDIHCDIVIVPPSEEQPFYKLVTMGAGAYEMNVPKELKSDVYDRAEYVIFLPEDWNLKSDKEEDYWPIRVLKTVARLTIGTEEWLYYGHTINLTEDGSSVAENTKFNSCVLLPSTGKEEQWVKPLSLGFGKKVAFFQIFPLYQEELEYKMGHSLDEMLDNFGDEIENNLVVDVHRKNFCK